MMLQREALCREVLILAEQKASLILKVKYQRRIGLLRAYEREQREAGAGEEQLEAFMLPLVRMRSVDSEQSDGCEDTSESDDVVCAPQSAGSSSASSLKGSVSSRGMRRVSFQGGRLPKVSFVFNGF
eukprot:Rhum_TRINITY_DN5598_c0_g1::Rhum_TRINITY_DN5598_c0_g1_i1::g.17787::m.17787